MLKSKKLKTLTAILATALFVSATNLTPAYAKGINKAKDEEYVKILKNLKADFSITSKKRSAKTQKPKSKNLKAHLQYEKTLKNLMGNPLKVYTEQTSLPNGDWSYTGKFAYHDFDGDKVDELICNFACYAWNSCMGTYRELIYTYKNGKATKILDSNNPLAENTYDFDQPYISENLNEAKNIYKIEKGKVLKIEEIEDFSKGNEIWETYYSGYEVKLVDITKANFNKYRKTYNSKAFRVKRY